MLVKKNIIRLGCFLALLVATLCANAAPKTASFLSIADIHFDPFIACVNTTPCPLIGELEQAPATQWPAILAAYDVQPPQYKQDSNFTLLTSAFTEFKQVAATSKPRFVLVLGDLLGHNYQIKYQNFSAIKTAAGYQDFVKKTQQFLAHEFAMAFPATDVYLTLGNNDSYLGDYVTDIHGAFLKDVTTIWSPLIKSKDNRNHMQHDFPYAGYYAIIPPNQSNLRLIILNTTLFSAKTPTDMTKDALGELEWLREQLLAATITHQQVLLAMHIPAGIDIYASMHATPSPHSIDAWHPEFTQRFADELKEFSANIMGILVAHAHSDYFQLLTNGYNKKIPISTTPSISSVNGNNPGFKLFSYATDSLQLQDYTTLFYPLDGTQTWQQEYDFNDVYQPGCQDCQLINGMQLLGKSDSPLVSAYKYYFATETNTAAITTAYYPNYWCQTKTLTLTEYQSCLLTAKQ